MLNLIKKLVAFLVVIVAVFLGWLQTTPLAMGYVFATLGPILEGHMPATIVGHGKMVGTPPVPDDMKPKPRPTNELFRTLAGTGDKMPMNGLGMCCRYTAYDDVLVRRSVLWFLLLGGRHIDTAHIYLNHKAIGLGIQDAMERGIPREEIFVTTKVWPGYFGYNSTLEAATKFPEELGLEHVDMILMHMPKKFPLIPAKDCAGLSDKECRKDTWRALSELRSKGITRNVGVSNFKIEHIQEVEGVEGGAPVADHQFLFNVFSPPSSHETFDYCLDHDIAVTAYYSLGSALQHSQAATAATLQELADKHNKSIAQIMLRWSMQRGAVVIPGSGNPKHMEQNLAASSFELSEEDMGRIDELKNDELASEFMSQEDIGKMLQL